MHVLLLARLSVHVHQQTKGTKVRRPLRGCTLFIEGHKTHKRCTSFFLGEEGDHYLHASPKMRSSNRFANIIPIQSAEHRTRDEHTRGFPSSERAGRLYFFFFFFFYDNGVFFFSRWNGHARRARNVRRKRRGGGIFNWFFSIKKFLSPLDSILYLCCLDSCPCYVRRVHFRFIVSLKCVFSIEPISRTREESPPFPVPLTKWRLRYFRAVNIAREYRRFTGLRHLLNYYDNRFTT